MAMFSRKKLATATASAAPAFRPQDVVLKAIRNPYISASAAATLFLATVLTLIAVAGDPKAGTPQVRISLAKVAAMAAPPGWREAIIAQGRSGEGAVSEDVFQLSATPIPPGGGEAVITLPGEAKPAFHAADPLPQAPIAGFSAQGPGGPLPIISTDGRTPAEVYARPFVSNGRPKIALMIGGLGLNATATRQAIESLPAEVTLSFVPYADGLQGWIDMARANGHEVLLEVPMEPTDYPENDPGPYTLLATAQGNETVKRLEWVLSRATGYFGLTNYLGSRFVTSETAMSAFAGALKGRGLAFVDDGSAARKAGGIPRASASRIIDEELSNTAIDEQLLALEASALQSGQALGSGFAYPVTLNQVAAWAQSVESRGYQLAPASALTHSR